MKKLFYLGAATGIVGILATQATKYKPPTPVAHISSSLHFSDDDVSFSSLARGAYSTTSSFSQCTSTNGFPDPQCTPGVTDPLTTKQTLCDKSYSTKSVRPPSSYTSSLKREQMKEYGYTDTDPSHYEEDHLISLELGGAPSDPKNLWPEPGASPNPKDKVENRCHKMICAGQISLSDAQHQIATNWKNACQ